MFSNILFQTEQGSLAVVGGSLWVPCGSSPILHNPITTMFSSQNSYNTYFQKLHYWKNIPFEIGIPIGSFNDLFPLDGKVQSNVLTDRQPPIDLLDV